MTAAEAAADVGVEPEAPDAGFGLPVGVSGPGGDVGVPLAATAVADGSDGSEAGAVGTAGSAALAGTTTAVAGAVVGVCLLQLARIASVATDVHLASLLILPARGAGRTASEACASAAYAERGLPGIGAAR